MTRRQPLSRPGEDPQAPASVYATTQTTTNARPEKACTPPLQRSRLERVQGCGDISFTI